jgi:hypothetical protein
MKIRFSVLCFFLIVVHQTAIGQSDDFGIWYGINATHPVSKKLDIIGTAMVRTIKNASKIEEAYLDGGISFNLNNYLSFAGSYRITRFLELDSDYHIRHKWFFDVRNNLPLGKVLISTRFRFQIQKKTYFKTDEDKLPGYYGRIRLKAAYKFNDFPLSPYLYIETFSTLFDNSDLIIYKVRYSGGLEYKIAKKHSVTTEYLFERSFLPGLSDKNIISVSYYLKF